MSQILNKSTRNEDVLKQPSVTSQPLFGTPFYCIIYYFVFFVLLIISIIFVLLIINLLYIHDVTGLLRYQPHALRGQYNVFYEEISFNLLDKPNIGKLIHGVKMQQQGGK